LPDICIGLGGEVMKLAWEGGDPVELLYQWPVVPPTATAMVALATNIATMPRS